MSTTLTVADVLRKARELYVQAPSHAPVGEMPPVGTHCLSTALQACAGRNDYVSVNDAFNAIELVIGTPKIAKWNAENSTETVLAAFDAAIEATS